MVKRRRIGPAFEKSPIQRLNDWSTRNILILIGTVGICIGYWLVVNFVVDFLLNFMVTQGQEEMEKPYSSDDPNWIIIKLVGCLLIFFIIIKTKTK